jgi:hypothetical protein
MLMPTAREEMRCHTAFLEFMSVGHDPIVSTSTCCATASARCSSPKAQLAVGRGLHIATVFVQAHGAADIVILVEGFQVHDHLDR